MEGLGETERERGKKEAETYLLCFNEYTQYVNEYTQYLTPIMPCNVS